MAAIRMEANKNITVLINPQKDGEIKEGVYLTRNYKNASGILPEENIFISNDEKLFRYLGYYENWQKEIINLPEHNKILEKILNYII